MKKLWYLLVLLVPVLLIAAANPETKDMNYTYRVNIVRGDTTLGTTAALTTVSAQSESVKVATIDATKWDKLWVRVLVHEYFESGDAPYSDLDSLNDYGLRLHLTFKGDDSVVAATGVPVNAMVNGVSDTAWAVYDLSHFYYNISDTTKFIPEVQLWAKAWGDSFWFATELDTTVYPTDSTFSGTAEDTLAVLRYDLQIKIVKK